jgi:uncharacterized RDD family membrane protein YckC
MACPLCGDLCHCNPEARARDPRPGSHRRFEPELPRNAQFSASTTVLIDPEAYDASEETFSASLDLLTAKGSASPSAGPRFVVDAAVAPAPDEGSAEICPDSGENSLLETPVAQGTNAIVRNDGLSSSTSDDDPSSWKQEVAARLNKYRARRKPRPPKYPSLTLSFEPEPSPSRSPSIETAALAAARCVLPVDEVESGVSEPLIREGMHAPEQGIPVQEETYTGARIIEFPRSYAPPQPSPDELAEAVCERPRILDAPEVELPPPALGGITLESPPQPEPEQRPGFEVPLQSSPLSRRLSAAAIDLVLVLSAVMVFGYIFLRITKLVPPTQEMLALGVTLAAVLWTGYQYLLLTYSGTTPGLRAMKLRVSHFDGTPTKRRTRRWRVLASVLSGISLGLGFAWCFLDEDSLCWHDRITHTYLAPLDQART